MVENKKKYEVSILGKIIEIPEHTTFLDIVEKYQDKFEDDILLVNFNNRLKELSNEITGDGKLSFITAKDNNGRMTYRRSVVFLMQKALQNILKGKDFDFFVEHSLDQGYYCLLSENVKITADFLKDLKAEMNRLVSLDLKIEKYAIKTDEAAKLFHENRLFDKEKLMNYRTSSYINVYNLDGCIDYFYGYMTPSTKYLKYFDLKKYDDGFMILFPYKQTKKVAEFKPSHKLFEIQKKAAHWSDLINIPTVGALNEAIANGKGNDIILMQEALMEQQIGALAYSINKKKNVKFVMIAGPSSSGKTTFSYRLSIQLSALGLKPHPLSLDDYYIDRDKMEKEPDGSIDFESIKGIDTVQFNKDMNSLLRGETVLAPSFNFKTGKREYRGKKLRLKENDILVIEGIHGLNEQLSHLIPEESKFKIYISALTQLSIDEHNPLSTTDGRLIRRIVRDARTRGSSAKETLAMWESVRKGEEKNIFPYQEGANVMFNSALIYEMSILKLYATPLLLNIEDDCPEYSEAKRLLKLMGYFMPLTPDAVNNTSLLREFIGGGIIQV